MSTTPGIESDLWIIYKNHRGEVALRHIVPLFTHYTANEWHPEPCWIMQAFDLDKQEERSFAFKNILSTDVPLNHPARCDPEKWASMREALERGSAAKPEAEQALPTGGKDAVFPVLRRWIEARIDGWCELEGEQMRHELGALLPRINAREQYGINKYKQTLMTFDGRDTVKECEDELLDLLVYMVKARMEGLPFYRLYTQVYILNNLAADALGDKHKAVSAAPAPAPAEEPAP